MLGTTLFAIALGVFSGALTRRILASMLVALMLVAGARYVVGSQLRPSYQPPVVVTADRQIPADAWVLRSYYLDANGNVVPQERIFVVTEEYFRTRARIDYPSLEDYYARAGLFRRIEYQPREREVAFQVIELGIYGALAIALFGASLLLVRRRSA